MVKISALLLLVLVTCRTEAGDVDRFPVGLFAVPPTEADMKAVRAMGVSHVHVYTLGGTSPERLEYAKGYLDLAHKHGLKVMVDLNARRWFNKPDEGHKLLETFISRFKDHPAVAMWYLYDEPEPEATVDDLAPYYKWLKSASPAIPVSMALNREKHWKSFAAVTDVILNDYYPVRGQPSGQAPLDIPASFTRQALTLGKAVMPTLQCFSYGKLDEAKGKETYRSFPVKDLRYPTAEELRFMIYSNLAQGVRGIWFWSYLRGQRADPKWWDEVFTPVIRELRSFVDDVAPAWEVKPLDAGEHEVYLAVWKRGRCTWIVLANGRGEQREIDEPLDGITGSLSPVGTTRQAPVTVAGGRLKVTAAPCEVFVFKAP